MVRFPLLLLIFLILYGCEDVIDLDLPATEQRLIIDAVLEVDRTLECVPVIIETSLSTAFDQQIIPVSVTSLKIIVETSNEYGDSNGSNTIELNETESGSGVYAACFPQSIFSTELTYYLSIFYNERLYFSRTKFIPATTIDSIEHSDETFIEDDETEIIVTFTDNPDSDNLYIFNFERGNFVTTEDTFFQGEQYSFSYFLDEKYKSGESIEVTLLGADRQFFNYMNLLIEQTEDEFNIFDTPAATIRGNIFDFTDIDNRDQFDNTEATDTFPLGYFAIVEASKKTIILN